MDGFLKVITKGSPGEPYNIGNRPEINVNDLANIFIKIIQRIVQKTLLKPNTYPADEPMRRCPDIKKQKYS